ncbi:MAG: CPBP family intramembrane metalloprotease [Planctomycetes bacterium]|nr:CPBP family intramembrane metalloprotease [Planctomycetota bacterium]
MVSKKLDTNSVLLLASGFYLTLYIATLIWSYASDSVPFPFSDFRFDGDALTWCAIAFALGVAAVYVSRAVFKASDAERKFARMFRTTFGNIGWTEVLAYALLSGFFEEVFFRGAVQNAFGLVAASIIFGLAHYAGRDLIAWTISTVVMGFILGWIYIASKTIAAPIVLHFTVNAMNIRYVSKIDIEDDRT